MASSFSTAFVTPSINPTKLSSSHASSLTPRLQPSQQPYPANSHRTQPRRAVIRSSAANVNSSAGDEPERRGRGLIQHKKEAFWFYRFLSIVYDTIVNPFHWTKEMRDKSLEQAQLESAPGEELKVVDVGGGTGFCTEGVRKHVKAENITLLDQSPHQMAKAKKKELLQGVTFIEGDAENLPFKSGEFDRYTSAGSIEYWPEPQRGIKEAYRILKPGGYATMIGPVRATNPFSRFWCDLWMLFPMESEYIKWFKDAGFEKPVINYIGPKAYKGVRQHGLIMGLTITARKPVNGPIESPLVMGEMLESRDTKFSFLQRLLFLPKWFLGVIAGGYYFILPFLIIIYAALFIRQPKQVSQ